MGMTYKPGDIVFLYGAEMEVTETQSISYHDAELISREKYRKGVQLRSPGGCIYTIKEFGTRDGSLIVRYECGGWDYLYSLDEYYSINNNLKKLEEWI